MVKHREQRKLEREVKDRLENDELEKLTALPALPGTHIRCRRSADSKEKYEFYRVATAAPIATAYNRRRSYWNPREIIVAGTPYLVKRHPWSRNHRTEVIDTRIDCSALETTGKHFDHVQSTQVFLSEGRILTFPVQGMSRWRSEMRAIDAESKTWIRFRLQASFEKPRNWIEKILILIDPDITVTTEIQLTVAVMAGSLDSYFKERPGSAA